MVSQQTLQGHWHEIKGRLHERWAQLSDDDLQAVDANVEKLVGLIQRKSGEARESIEDFLDDVTKEFATSVERAADTARAYAHDASQRMRETSEQVSEKLQQGYAEAEHMIQRRPAESVAVAFGAGLVVGVVISLILRSR